MSTSALDPFNVVPPDILDDPHFWTLPPWYHCDIRTPSGTTIFWLTIDSKEGRVYETLKSDEERLPYIIGHCLEIRHSTVPDSIYYHDVAEKKRYRIRRNTPVYEGLLKLARPTGSMLWPKDSPEWAMVVQYYKAHAHEVCDAPVCFQ